MIVIFFQKITSGRVMVDECKVANLSAIESLLQSDKRLNRDKGVTQLKGILREDDGNSSQVLLSCFQNKLSAANQGSPWELIHGCLLGTRCVLQAVNHKDSGSGTITKESLEFFHMFAQQSLTHSEVRVRNEAGQVLGALCAYSGCAVYEQSKTTLLHLLCQDLERHIDADAGHESHSHTSIAHQPSVNSSDIFHESAGWRHLETTMKCLQYMIEGCGTNFSTYIDQELLDLLFSALCHVNRFVRETGFNVLAAMVNCKNAEDHLNPLLKYGKQLSSYLAKGLADNWSQVRLASSIATRNFLLSISIDQRQEYFSQLLPRLCLNRYYVAEGVRLYSQKTWAIVSEGHGKELVEKFISDVVSYYIVATQSDNHAVREAACACISELATKVNANAVFKHVPDLLQALLECFMDDSWPVRDAACVACGNFVLSYSEEARNMKDTLYELFMRNLKDPIASVRQGAAGAIAKFAKAYGGNVLAKVLEDILGGLMEVTKQKETAEKFTGLDKRPAQFGVVKDLHANFGEMDPLHTNQQMYSCGSLAPKMGRGGCSDCRFKKPSEPWEYSDGCIYLVAELSSDHSTEVTKLLPSIVKCLSHKHFSQHLVLLETVCKQLPVIATNIGKRNFKSSVELFLDPVFYGLECDVPLTVVAAEECLQKLSNFLGANILRGRIENHNPNYVKKYMEVLSATHYSSVSASYSQKSFFPMT